VRGRRPVL